MKRVLLISDFVFHYRIKIYDYFFKHFQKEGISFSVLTNNIQKVDFEYNVPIHIKKPGILTYLKYIREHKPDCIITFLHLKNPATFPVVFFSKTMKIPVIYWGFGIDMLKPESPIKNFLYRLLHTLSNAIIQYSPNEKDIIKSRHHHKIFAANNSLNLTEFDNIKLSGNYLKDNFSVAEKHIVLFVGNKTSDKKAEELLQCFRNHKEVAVVLVGNAIPDKMLSIIENTDNYYYLGEIYNNMIMANIYYSCDIVCIPGNIGLSIVNSFYWGKPLVTVKPPESLNSPEIWYLKNGKNGYTVQNTGEIETKIIQLLKNPDLYRRFSEYAKKTALNDAHISKMFKGFKEAIEYAIHSSRK